MSIRALALCVLAASACASLGDADEDSKAGDGLSDELTLDDGTPDPGTLAARVCAAGAMTKGIDVSRWQGTVDWAKVKSSGVEFAFLRVSDGAATQDPKFASNWSGTKAHGVIRGAYQFFRPSQSVTAQADLMIHALGSSYTPGDLPPVIDVEDAGGLAAATVAARVRQWVDRVHAAIGVEPIIYTGKFFWRDQVGGGASFLANPLWIAQYTSLCPDIPGPWARWTFWQHTDSGSVPGIAGNVDLDRFNGSLAQLQAFVHGVAPAPPAALPFSWVRTASGSYDFAVTPPAGVAKVELRVEDYLIGTVNGTGTLHYTFNVARADRVIDAKGIAADGRTIALGNGIIDSIAATSVAVYPTGMREYEIGLERAPSTWTTVEVLADGMLLTDIETGTTRSTRRAVRSVLATGTHALTIRARSSSGTIVDTRTRTLVVGS